MQKTRCQQGREGNKQFEREQSKILHMLKPNKT